MIAMTVITTINIILISSSECWSLIHPRTITWFLIKAIVEWMVMPSSLLRLTFEIVIMLYLMMSWTIEINVITESNVSAISGWVRMLRMR